MSSLTANKFSCPKCSVQTELLLPSPLVISCPSCQETFFIDKDQKATNAYLLKQDLSPLKVIELTSSGVYKKNRFTVIGHIRSINTHSITNEWLMKFDDNTFAWLIENGFKYYVFENDPISISANSIIGKSVGDIIKIKEIDYTIYDLSKQIKFRVDGQIPESDYNDGELFIYEAIADDSITLATIVIYDKTTVEAYKGIEINLPDLKISTLANFKKWLS
ncbi:MAG: hypothetical protein KA285_01555 [Bacteroidia bacterium]|nr:hypothetical protein [Bacteroidia bacterium]